MKKILYLAIAMLYAGTAIAQASKTSHDKKAFVAVSGGFALPVGVFSSTSTTNGGFAKSGFNLNVHGGYMFTPHFGLAGNAFYTVYGVDAEAIGTPGVKVDHWQYIGFAAGPALSVAKTEKLDITFNIFGGLAHANSPVITYETASSNEVWATALTMQLGSHLRYMLTPNTFLMGAADYTAMKPKWSDPSIGDYEQNMGGFHLTVGLGWRF